MSTRPPAVAGSFYPADPDALRRQVSGYMPRQNHPVAGRLRALVAPHAGYAYCGRITGQAFGLLRSDGDGQRQIRHIGPSHSGGFTGVAAGTDSAWQTPLGTVPVYLPPTLSSTGEVHLDSGPHAHEHSLEVHVPFMQLAMEQFTLTPLLTGDIAPGALAAMLEPLLDPPALIVASTDLSHYHSQRQAVEIDGRTNRAVAALDVAALLACGEACGLTALAAVLILAQQQGWKAHVLDYATSGDITGDHSHVVGYAAYAFTA